MRYQYKNIFDDMLIKSNYEDTYIKTNKCMIKREQELHELGGLYQP